jgi:hypothetical protein
VTQAVGDSAVTGASANFANGAHQHALTRPSFDDLSDVVVSGATAGQHVVFDGSNWVTTSIHPLFGDGSDGTVHLTSAGTTPDPNSGATRSGTTWTLVRDVYATDFTVDNGVTVNVLYRIMCTGTMTNNGTMTNPGGSAVSSGNGTGTRGFHAQGGSGGAGILSGTTTVAGTPGNTMGASGSFVYYGGTGGAGGNGNGGAGATRTAGTMLDTNQRRMAFELVMGVFATSPTSFSGAGVGVSAIGPGAGGGGGGRTTGGTATIAGAGGAGGGIILIAARIIDNSGGTITAPGGNGGNASGGTCVTGGGGGGGGGAVILVYKKLTAGTETAPGGTKGTGLNAASAAADGGSGTVLKVAI